MFTHSRISGLAAGLLLLPGFVFGAEEYSPYLDRSGMESVYWGDTHLHTAYSTDAGMIGTTIGPDAAYRFALGEEVLSSTGVRARIARPLDFLVVSDHAENLGLAPSIANSNPKLLANPWGRDIHDLVKAGKPREAFLKWGTEAMLPLKDPLADTGLAKSIWASQVATADQYNQPGTFTALIGYEWTSTPEGNNLHRVVIFRDDASKAGQVMPYSQYDSIDPEDLWAWMASYQQQTGGQILAIPHNGNLSNGLMFAAVRMNGDAIDLDYAQRRSRWEPLAEVSQIKGDGEAHPYLSPEDEFADFGTWDKANIASSVRKQESMLEFEYARSALKNGLAFAAKTGGNPYRFGMIGASDSHTAIPSTREENYFGKFALNEPHAGRWKHYVIQSFTGDDSLSTMAYEELASGLAAVWAQENTREALFDAMRRKEVYATTGTRPLVRVFGGWDFTEADLHSPQMAAIGYSKGVPMGGDLGNGGEGSSPVFMLTALKDPDGANLDRMQVVKGWLGNDGQPREKVYNVAVSQGRTIRRNGKVKPVGNTVDLDSATYTNDIGSVSLSTLWHDPDFDPAQRAFYYVRVLEIPTPSWQTFDRKVFGDDMPDHVDKIVQDRAYTSPIWYSPNP